MEIDQNFFVRKGLFWKVNVVGRGGINWEGSIGILGVQVSWVGRREDLFIYGVQWFDLFGFLEKVLGGCCECFEVLLESCIVYVYLFFLKEFQIFF